MTNKPDNNYSLDSTESGLDDPEFIKSFTLEKMQFHIRSNLSYEILKQSKLNLRKHLDLLSNSMLLDLTTYILQENIKTIECRYPADWKEAFKDRWFPDWLKKKYPVKWVHEKLDKIVLYNQLSLPDQPYHTFLTQVKNNYWIPEE
jgi:hypothetical protein